MLFVWSGKWFDTERRQKSHWTDSISIVAGLVPLLREELPFNHICFFNPIKPGRGGIHPQPCCSLCCATTVNGQEAETFNFYNFFLYNFFFTTFSINS